MSIKSLIMSCVFLKMLRARVCKVSSINIFFKAAIRHILGERERKRGREGERVRACTLVFGLNSD